MRKSSSFRSGMGTGMLLGLGFVVALALGIGLLVAGYVLGRSTRQPVAPRPTATVPAAMTSTPTEGIVAIIPTATPTPTDTPTPLPTPVPPTDTPLPPLAVVGTQGANIRSGPGTNFSIVGRVEPGTQLLVIGRYADWWQVLYNSAPAWIAGIVVTTSNTEGVPVVVPPPSPIPPPPTAIPTATPIPATATPANVRGLTVRSFVVSNKPRREGGTAVYAPGPFGVNSQIWCAWDIANTSSQTIAYTILGCWVEETGSHKKSYGDTTLQPGQTMGLKWEDWLSIGVPGTYRLWLRICFTDGTCANLAGPVTVTVQ